MDNSSFMTKNIVNTLLLIFFLCSQVTKVYAQQVPDYLSATHQQLILVLTDKWQADHGLLYSFEKSNNIWQLIEQEIPVSVGKKGLAWGIGLHDMQSGIYKKEGDGKAPAGIFTLGSAFGYLTSLNTHLAYQQMTKSDYCVDVNSSSYYNQIVNAKKSGKSAIAGSTEPMRRDIHLNGDNLYKKGVVINHNLANKRGQGSCIFMHIWRKKGAPTAGCTAMAENNLTLILAWLDKSKQPLYITLPIKEYLAKQQQWSLPKVSLLEKSVRQKR